MENNDTALAPTLDQLTVEVKFYLKQTAQNIIEVGKRLIQAKALLPHGEFGNWLKNNFGLSHNAANKFMKCAERFSNCSTSNILNQSQMFELLALPADETEAFIEEKAAAGTPVEDMTVKNLRAEIQQWKSRAEVNANAADEKDRRISQLATDFNKLQGQNAQLQRSFDDANRLLTEIQKKPPTVIEKPPADYEQVKRDLARIKGERDQLQKDLNAARNNPKIPDDYAANKKRLTELDAQIARMQQEIDAHATAEDYANAAQKLDAIFALITDVSNSPNVGRVVADYERNNPERYHLLCASFSDFIRIMEME